MFEFDFTAMLDLAWLAGIVDGEGHIGLSRKKSAKRRNDGEWGKVWVGYAPVLCIAINSEAVCRHAAQIVGEGEVRLKQILHDKEHWIFRVRNQQAGRVLRILEPFLVEKKRQAQLVIRATTINANYQVERKWRARLPERATELELIASELHAIHGTKHRTLMLN
jgi:hypothetical protein